MTTYTITEEQRLQLLEAFDSVAGKGRRCEAGVAMLQSLQPNTQEPVAWMRKDGNMIAAEEKRTDYAYTAHYDKPLYTAPQPSTQKPVQVWCDTCEGSGKVYEESQFGMPGSGGDLFCPDCDGKGFYLSAPQQPADFVGLTVVERAEATSKFAHVRSDDMLGIAEAIENKLSQKNADVQQSAELFATDEFYSWWEENPKLEKQQALVQFYGKWQTADPLELLPEPMKVSTAPSYDFANGWNAFISTINARGSHDR